MKLEIILLLNLQPSSNKISRLVIFEYAWIAERINEEKYEDSMASILDDVGMSGVTLGHLYKSFPFLL
jgi:hypothetical protein